MGKRAFLSLIIIAFWVTAVFQIFHFREDYPFSYFGMYKSLVPPGPYSYFEIKTWRDEIEVSPTKIFDISHVNDKLHVLLLQEILPTNQTNQILYRPMSFHEITDKQKTQVEELIDKSIFSSSCPHLKRPCTFRIQVVFKEWKRINASNIYEPDVNIPIFDKSFKRMRN